LDDFLMHVLFGLPFAVWDVTTEYLERMQQRMESDADFAIAVRRASAVLGVSLNPWGLEADTLALHGEVAQIVAINLGELNRHVMEVHRRVASATLSLYVVAGGVRQILSDGDHLVFVLDGMATNRIDRSAESVSFLVCAPSADALPGLRDIQRFRPLIIVGSIGAPDWLAEDCPLIIDNMRCGDWETDAYAELTRAVRRSRDRSADRLVGLIRESDVPVITVRSSQPHGVERLLQLLGQRRADMSRSAEP
jgi:hypothetical protein